MRRGALSEEKAARRAEISAALEAQGLPAALARRMAFQFVFKFRDDELGDHAVWRAAGQILRQEVARLQHHVGLGERQIIRVVPKLSAREVEEFLDELTAADRRIARTIFDAAIEAAHPVATGRRYLTEYQAVAEQLRALDPTIARTLANAYFKAGTPLRTAIERFRAFTRLLKTFDTDAAFARMLAKSAFRAADPLKAATALVADYERVVTGLIEQGVDPQLARTLAASSRFRSSFGSRKSPQNPDA